MMEQMYATLLCLVSGIWYFKINNSVFFFLCIPTVMYTINYTYSNLNTYHIDSLIIDGENEEEIGIPLLY